MSKNSRCISIVRGMTAVGLVTMLHGCTSRERDVSYNPYIPNKGDLPLLRAMEVYGPDECDFWLNDLDGRIENAVY